MMLMYIMILCEFKVMVVFFGIECFIMKKINKNLYYKLYICFFILFKLCDFIMILFYYFILI